MPDGMPTREEAAGPSARESLLVIRVADEEPRDLGRGSGSGAPATGRGCSGLGLQAAQAGKGSEPDREP